MAIPLVMMPPTHEKHDDHGDYDCKRPGQRNTNNGASMMRKSILVGTRIVGGESASLNDRAVGYHWTNGGYSIYGDGRARA